jgi:ribonuclease E
VTAPHDTEVRTSRDLADSTDGGNADAASGEARDGDGAPRKPRRRGSRGGRNRSKSRSTAAATAEDEPGEGGADDTLARAERAADADAAAQVEGEPADGRSARAGGRERDRDGRARSAGRAGADNEATAASAGPAEAADDAATAGATTGEGEPRTGGGRKRRRGGGGRNAGADDAAGAAAAPAADAGGDPGDAAAASGDRTPELPDTHREGRPKSVKAAAKALVPKIPPPRKPKIGDTIPVPAAGSDAKGEEDGRSGDAKRKRRRRRGKGGDGDPRPVEAMLPSGVELDDAALERRKGRERKGRPVGRYSMTVHHAENATQIAVLEGRALIEHYVSRPSDDISQIHGNIYLGRVQNVLPGMEAAFVDIGTPKNAVLYRGDVHHDQEDVERGAGQPRIEHMLRAGQSIVCQVTKNPIGAKGARLTQEVSLPGRFVVLIPNSSTYGISKRLADDERKRLRQILDAVKPAQHGIIVRTAAQNVTTEEIQDDVRRLASQWQKIESLAKRSKAPALLYREPDMSVRVIREEFNQDYRNVQIDDPTMFAAVRDYVASISPELADRVEYYDTDKEKLPLFERFHVHEQLHKALDRKVWLPSGGSLIIERTEALTVIDVNTGKNVGRSSLEETVTKNNLEAAVEIARQLRLRDIGGIIVIDFIDMERKENRDEVTRVFRDALSRDKTRTQVFDISELGLCEMTRKRIGEGLLESFSLPCPECEARGVVIDKDLLPD